MSENAQGTFTDWFWPDPPVSDDGRAGYSSFEHALVVEVDPGPDSAYFWAHQFALIGGGPGYLGLQTKGRTNGTLGKVAIFSIWDAVAAKGKQASRFSGEGEGWSCGLGYPWEVGRPYRLRVWSPERSWWVASVVDEVTAVETEIGWIQVPHGWQRLDGRSIMWTEWYGGPLARCDDIPHSSVVFRTPTAEDGMVLPERGNGYLATAAASNCDHSDVERLEDGYRQQIGIIRG